MAFALNQLRLIASGAEGTPTIAGPNVVNNVYHYGSADAEATVVAANYFDLALSLLQVGDLILCTLGIGGTLNCRMVVVASNDGTHVTTTKSLAD